MAKAKRVIQALRLAALLIIPILLLILPKTYFDGGRSICLSVLLLDTECYACGMTRACMRLIHFDFSGAYAYNKLSVIVFPILAYLWASWIYQSYRLTFVVKHK